MAAPFDVTDLDAVLAGVRQVEADLGPIDILVNNAGIVQEGPRGLVQFRDLDPSEWHRSIDLNVYGVLNCVKATIDGMCDRGFGRIVTISSGAGTQGLRIGVSTYAAGKGGAIGFMRHLALETAQYGVTANTLALGLDGERRRRRVRPPADGLRSDVRARGGTSAPRWCGSRPKAIG